MTALDAPSKAGLSLRTHNPDVITCIANLSNDEVFTPPELANQMLDEIENAWAESHDGASIWTDPNVTFLDPFTKSGVFLREITARLTRGLEAAIPDLAERVDHILTKQVFGIGITRLTSLLARRSLYCSKDATGKHSIASGFDRDWGNVWFERTEHTWAGDRCVYCPAARADYDRGDDLETHAYAFTHTSDVKKRLARMFGDDVQFDVIVGNPPYQLSDGSGAGSGAMPIYQKFIARAQELSPQFLSMIIPSKWFSGGRGLDDFRASMLADRRLRRLVDYPDSRDAFAGVDVAGGVCYFLWDRDRPGTCFVDTVTAAERISAERILNEYDVFVRQNRALAVVKKIQLIGEPALSTVVSARRPFGIDSSHERDTSGDLYLYATGTDGRIERSDVPKGVHLIDTWKVLLSKTSSEHAGQVDKSGRRRVLSRIEVMPPATVATESYLIVGPLDGEAAAENVVNYLRTRFVRFLVATVLLTQNITRSSFAFVPVQDFSRSWSDEELYEKYGITDDEIVFIESQIKEIVVVDG